MMNKIGWIGSTLLALCAAPEAYRALTSVEYSISILFILMWGIGELLILITLLAEKGKSYLVFNYALNLIFIMIISNRLLREYL